jgi:hypothetical protein
LQGAVHKPKITSSIGIVDPSIRSLKVETSSRVSQQRFHVRTCYRSKDYLIVGEDPRSEKLKLRIRCEVANNPMEKTAPRREGTPCYNGH